MLIGIDASRAGKKQKTGTEWYSYHLISYLAKIDLKNKYLLYTRYDSLFLPENLPDNFQIKILNWPFKYLWTHLRLSWEMLIRPPDILFVPAHTLPLIHRKRTIVTIHDLGFIHNPEIYHPLARFYHLSSAWWSIKFSIKIITISQFTKKDIYNYFGKLKLENKLFVIPLGVEFEKYNSKINAIEVLQKYKLDKPFFLYIGRIEKKKNVQMLVNVWQKLQNLHDNFYLVLVGNDGFGSKQINSFIEKVKSIKKIGYVSEQEKIALLQSTHSFIFPSKFEGFGLPILEAMAAGCLVLSSRNAALPEVGGNCVWYFDHNDQKSLLNLILKTLNVNDREIQNLKLKASERAKKFSWLKSASETLMLLINENKNRKD